MHEITISKLEKSSRDLIKKISKIIYMILFSEKIDIL